MHGDGAHRAQRTVGRKLKAWRGTATRYDKTHASYLSGLYLRASMVWLKDLARAALHRYLAGRRIGISGDPNQTVGEYLTDWLAAQKLRLKPTTWVRYRDYTRNDLIPALGAIRLDDLAYEHLHHFTPQLHRRRPGPARPGSGAGAAPGDLRWGPFRHARPPRAVFAVTAVGAGVVVTLLPLESTPSPSTPMPVVPPPRPVPVRRPARRRPPGPACASGIADGVRGRPGRGGGEKRALRWRRPGSRR